MQIEGCDPAAADRRILLVGATNRPEELDEAARCETIDDVRLVQLASLCLMPSLTSGACGARKRFACARVCTAIAW